MIRVERALMIIMIENIKNWLLKFQTELEKESEQESFEKGKISMLRRLRMLIFSLSIF